MLKFLVIIYLIPYHGILIAIMDMEKQVDFPWNIQRRYINMVIKVKQRKSVISYLHHPNDYSVLPFWIIAETNGHLAPVFLLAALSLEFFLIL